MEKRFNPSTVTIEKREDGTPTISGYASVFYDETRAGTEYELRPGVVERVDRRAFDRAIKNGADVRALFNHDPNHLLGRSKSGTLRLSVDSVGLRYEIDPPDTQAGRDIMASIQRGDLTGSSFSFGVADGGQRIERDDKRGVTLRVLNDLDLFDVGPVTYPAYEGATVGMRAIGAIDDCSLEVKPMSEVKNEGPSIEEVRRRLAAVHRMEMEAEEAAPDPEAAVKQSFREAVVAVLDSEGEMAEKLSKIKALLKAEEAALAVVGGDSEPEEPAAEEEPEEIPA
jgi:HK97 family phage prohead protease